MSLLNTTQASTTTTATTISHATTGLHQSRDNGAAVPKPVTPKPRKPANGQPSAPSKQPTKAQKIEAATVAAVDTYTSAINASDSEVHANTVAMLKKLVKAGGSAQLATRAVIKWHNSRKRMTGNWRSFAVLVTRMCPAVQLSTDGKHKLVEIKKGKSYVWTYVEGWPVIDWATQPGKSGTPVSHTDVNQLTEDFMVVQLEGARKAAEQFLIRNAKKFYANLPTEQQTQETVKQVERSFNLPADTLADALCTPVIKH